MQVLCQKCGGRLVGGSRFCNLCGAPVMAPSAAGAEKLPVSKIEPGMLLEGKWRVELKIGEGAMGTVYRCTDVALDRPVAIKVLAAEHCADQVFVARFEREAKLTANLEHPNVVLVYGVGRHEGRPFIVMKWIAGETLASRLDEAEEAKERIPVETVRSVVAQICAGLGYIHQRSLVHRDIKDANIVVDAHGRATILDFGILRDLSSNEHLTQAGFVMGTPAYIAPEVIRGKQVDHRSDLYAVGVLLYQLLTGALPFDAESEHELVRKHVQEPPPDPCLRNPFLPAAVGRLLQKAIAKDPAQRFQTAADLAREFERAFAEPAEEPAEEPVVEERPTNEAVAEDQRPTRVLRDGPTTDRDLTGEILSARRNSRRALWEGMALGVLTALLLATVALYTLAPRAPPPPEQPVAAESEPVEAPAVVPSAVAVDAGSLSGADAAREPADASAPAGEPEGDAGAGP
jgi:serine/threonine protein kinase